jgi:hypothetical protein
MIRSPLGNEGGAGSTTQTMRAIINQKANPPSLPELRNLGTVLRVLLAVNGVALVMVFAREARWEALSEAWLETAAIV